MYVCALHIALRLSVPMFDLRHAIMPRPSLRGTATSYAKRTLRSLDPSKYRTFRGAVGARTSVIRVAVRSAIKCEFALYVVLSSAYFVTSALVSDRAHLALFRIESSPLAACLFSHN